MELGPQHKKWADRLKTGRDICEMAPRDHGKSMSLARAYTIWKIKYSPWVKESLILGPDLPSAVENLDKIKELLEANQKLRYLIPTTKKDFFYSRTEIKLTNGKSIKVKGWGSPLRGRHPQLIVLDDVLNEGNSLTPEDRLHTKNHFNEVVVPMKDKGFGKTSEDKSQIVIIGTAQDRDDLYHNLQKSGEYLGEKLSAVLDDELKIALWPERYTYQDLMAIKRVVGTLSFSKEYLNKPITEETSLFPPSLFEPLKDKDLSYCNSYQGPLTVYMGADFSVPGSMDGDWTVVIVIGMDPATQEFTVLNYWREKPNEFGKQLNQIELMCQMFNVTFGYLEDNMFQRIYMNMVRQKSALPLSGNTVTNTNKTSLEYGILSFRPQFENMKWRFPYKTDADKVKTDLIITEFNGIVQRKGRIGNESYHDDIVMAMWHALCAARAGTGFQVSWGT